MDVAATSIFFFNPPNPSKETQDTFKGADLHLYPEFTKPNEELIKSYQEFIANPTSYIEALEKDINKGRSFKRTYQETTVIKEELMKNKEEYTEIVIPLDSKNAPNVPKPPGTTQLVFSSFLWVICDRTSARNMVVPASAKIGT